MAEPFQIEASEVEQLAKALAEKPPYGVVTLARDKNVLIVRYRLRTDDKTYPEGDPHQIVLVDGQIVA